MCKNIPTNVTKIIYDKIQKLFNKFSCQYDFKWEKIAEIFNVKRSRVSKMVALLLGSNLIVPSDSAKYKFKNKCIKQCNNITLFF